MGKGLGRKQAWAEASCNGSFAANIGGIGLQDCLMRVSAFRQSAREEVPGPSRGSDEIAEADKGVRE